VPGLRQATCAAPHNFSLGGYAQAIANGAGGGSRPPLLAGVPLGEGPALVPSPRCSSPSGAKASGPVPGPRPHHRCALPSRKVVSLPQGLGSHIDQAPRPGPTTWVAYGYPSRTPRRAPWSIRSYRLCLAKGLGGGRHVTSHQQIHYSPALNDTLPTGLGCTQSRAPQTI